MPKLEKQSFDSNMSFFVYFKKLEIVSQKLFLFMFWLFWNWGGVQQRPES